MKPSGGTMLSTSRLRLKLRVSRLSRLSTRCTAPRKSRGYIRYLFLTALLFALLIGLLIGLAQASTAPDLDAKGCEPYAAAAKRISGVMMDQFTDYDIFMGFALEAVQSGTSATDLGNIMYIVHLVLMHRWPPEFAHDKILEICTGSR